MGLLSAPASPAATLPAGLLSAWLAQSHDLLALTDATGCIRWCSPAFERSGGLGAGADLSMLALPTGPSHDTLTAGLRGLDSPFAEVALRGAAGATLWVEVRVAGVGADRLWTLRDTTAQHVLAVRAQHFAELLDITQEFGRPGVWEREIPSGAGRWDRHVFGFWGIPPDAGTPDPFQAATRVRPTTDRTSTSTRPAAPAATQRATAWFARTAACARFIRNGTSKTRRSACPPAPSASWSTTPKFTNSRKRMTTLPRS